MRNCIKKERDNLRFYTCNEKGHFAQGFNKKREVMRCWKRGKEGHRERECGVDEKDRE